MLRTLHRTKERFNRLILRLIVLLGLLLILMHPVSSAATVSGKVELQFSEGAAVFPDRYGSSQAPEAREGRPEAAVVFLKALDPLNNTPLASPAASQLIQRNLEFVPDVLAIQTGTRVEFINQDDEYHNILSYSKTKRFDLGRYRKEDPAPVVEFNEAGVVKIYCEIHKHMRGVILVLDTPYFQAVSADGTFHIDNVPPGRYEIQVWSRRDKFDSQTVTLTEAGQEVSFNPL